MRNKKEIDYILWRAKRVGLALSKRALRYVTKESSLCEDRLRKELLQDLINITNEREGAP